MSMDGHLHARDQKESDQLRDDGNDLNQVHGLKGASHGTLVHDHNHLVRIHVLNYVFHPGNGVLVHGFEDACVNHDQELDGERTCDHDRKMNGNQEACGEDASDHSQEASGDQACDHDQEVSGEQLAKSRQELLPKAKILLLMDGIKEIVGDDRLNHESLHA